MGLIRKFFGTRTSLSINKYIVYEYAGFREDWARVLSNKGIKMICMCVNFETD